MPIRMVANRKITHTADGLTQTVEVGEEFEADETTAMVFHSTGTARTTEERTSEGWDRPFTTPQGREIRAYVSPSTLAAIDDCE